jgi:DNA polymerase elongation subunit (family B)
LQTTFDEPLNLSEKLSKLLAPAIELEEGLLVSATYDGDKKLAVLKFYDPKRDRVWRWEDNTGHKPYCYTKLPMSELGALRSRSDVVGIEEIQRRDLLSDSSIMVRKIIASDPLAIGSSTGKSIRDEIEAWEADIKYYENYVYDRGLRVGTYYKIHDGQITALEQEMPQAVANSLNQILTKNTGEQVRFIREWAELLGQPLCSFKRIALDIEVANEESRIPDPEKADRPVIAISFHNDSESLVYLVAKEGDASLTGAKTAYTPKVFADEASMLRAAFSKIMDYPFLITFNGDDFDLRYIVNRAVKFLGIRDDEIPIYLMRQEASLKHGVHIDLYRFFNNRSIQVYVYSNRYSEHTLNGISEAVLNKSKIEFDGNVGDLPLLELSNYCLNDSQLTYELTNLNSSLLMKILLVVSRIAKMPMNDVARLGVSNWIRSMLFYEHRRMGALIPRQDELAQKGGASSEAIIKGKKYKGGLVIEPKPGVYFGVSVLDFASLYPSIIKVYNLSYETVNCPHEECRSNKVPDTDHWVCTKVSGIESLVTGSLRDLRVGHYKPLAKDPSLSGEDRELFNTVTQGLKVILNACFTGDTSVVTTEGVKNIRDMRVGDRVINLNPETLEIEIDRVVEVQQFPYKGDLLHFRDRGFVDLMVTPNHRFLTTGDDGQRAVFRTAEDVFDGDDIEIPQVKAGITVSQMGRVPVLEAPTELGTGVNPSPDGGQSASAATVPQIEVSDTPSESRKSTEGFLELADTAEGSATQPCYSTASRARAEQMVVLYSLMGNKSRIEYHDGIFKVVSKNTSSRLTYSGHNQHRFVSKVTFDGPVYCVTTEKNHTVIAGRDGRFTHVGQSYGVMGFETFALYCLPVAEATAAYGRYAITKTIEKCKQEGISVIYSDTDSLFVENPNKSKIEELTKWAEHDLGVELDVDKTYRYVAFSDRKKNYFGVLQDGTADIKGLTGKKSMTPEFLKKAFYECLVILGTVYAPADFERARKEIKSLLTKMVSSLRNKEISLEELSFNVMIGKAITGFSGTTPQHVRAAKLLQDTGKEIKAGDIISFVKTKTPPNVKPVSLARVDEVDVDKYLEYASAMFDQMLDSLGFSFDEILGSTTLDAFWS